MYETSVEFACVSGTSRFLTRSSSLQPEGWQCVAHVEVMLFNDIKYSYTFRAYPFLRVVQATQKVEPHQIEKCCHLPGKQHQIFGRQSCLNCRAVEAYSWCLWRPWRSQWWIWAWALRQIESSKWILFLLPQYKHIYIYICIYICIYNIQYSNII